jgi:Zn finger protein HypA/HybF involved in hydrogenase expression
MNQDFRKANYEVYKVKPMIQNEKVLRNCNLCSEHFRPRSRFDRYCSQCKEQSETFKYGNWLPEMGDDLAIRFL